MEEFISDVKIIAAKDSDVFAKLSNLENLQQFSHLIPEDSALKDLKCDRDSVSFNINPVGDVKLAILDREPNKTIKFGVLQAPVAANFWIQMVGKNDNETKLRLTLKAELPFMIKMMVGSKIKDGINRFADLLAQLPYDSDNSLLDNSKLAENG